MYWQLEENQFKIIRHLHIYRIIYENHFLFIRDLFMSSFTYLENYL